MLTILTLAACNAPLSSTLPQEEEAEDSAAELEVVEHCGAIDGDQTWAAAREHQVTCDVTVERGTLTIAAGAVVTFDENADLDVGTAEYEASLVVEGTANAVVFSRSGTGAWGGITIGEFAAGVNVSGLTMRGSTGGFVVNGAEVEIHGLAVDEAEECGFTLNAGGRLTESSEGLIVTGAGGWSVCGEVATAHTLPSAASVYTGNAADGVYLVGDAVSDTVTWESLGVPYVIAEVVDVSGTAGEPANLTFGPGTTVLVERDRGFRFSRTGDASQLIAEGTAEEPIVFDALGADTAGYWRGIEVFAGASEARLAYVSISGAGGNDAALSVEDADLFVDNVSVTLSASVGVLLSGSAEFSEGSTALAVSSSSYPLEMPARAVHTIPVDGLVLTGNTTDAVRVAGETSVSAGGVWIDAGVPYWIVDDILLDGTADNPAVIELSAGVTALFDNDARVSVGKTGAAGFRAVGTEVSPVVMLPWSADIAGAWGGVAVYDAAVDSLVSFEHVEIGYAGGASLRGNLHLVDSAPTLRNVYLHDSEEWGLFLSDAAPTLEGVTYANNALGECNECI